MGDIRILPHSFLQFNSVNANRGALVNNSCRASLVSRVTGRVGATGMKLGNFSLLEPEDDPSLFTLRERLGRDVACKAQHNASPATEAEKQDWEKRQNEADNGGFSSSWHWTLNWNEVTPNIVIGSCPRSPDDVDRIAEGCGANAILNVQSDACFDALKIPFESIRRRASERGVYLERVPIRDFDHGDQALMLPEAVRMLSLLLARGMKVYVHCTAGINRASLTVVGYFTFIQGMELDDAVRLVKSARTIAHPYLDSWTEARRRLLDGRSEELTAISRQIYECRRDKGLNGNSKSDWEAAQKQAVSSTFNRWLKIDLSLIETELELLDRQYAAALRKVKNEFEREIVEARAEGDHLSFDYSQYVIAASAVASPALEDDEEQHQQQQKQQEQQEEKVIKAELRDEEDASDEAHAAVECDIVTRECFSSNEGDRLLLKPLRGHLSRSFSMDDD